MIHVLSTLKWVPLCSIWFFFFNCWYIKKKSIFLALKFEYSPIQLHFLLHRTLHFQKVEMATTMTKPLIKVNCFDFLLVYKLRLDFFPFHWHYHYAMLIGIEERESHARTWVNAFINIPVIYIACSYLWRIFCYIICLCISRFSAFVYQENNNRIKCDYRCRVINFILGCTAFSR